MNRKMVALLALAIAITGGSTVVYGAESNLTVEKERTLYAGQSYITRDPVYDLNDTSVNRMESEHFQIIWGNEDTTGTVNRAFVQGNLENLENIRSFYMNELGMDDPGVSMNPYFGDGKYKTNIYIAATGLDKIETDWAYMSVDKDSFGYIVMAPGAMRVDPPSWVVPHEYAHVVTYHQGGSVPGEWYESMANWYRDQYLGSSYYKYGNNVYGPESDFFAPVVLNSDLYFPHLKNWYDDWAILLYATENPDNMNGLGLQLMQNLVHSSESGNMFQVLEKLSGVSIKDILGGYARRMVTMDYSRQENYLKYLNELLADSSNYNKIYTTLQDQGNGWLRVSDSRAPQQGGYNIIPLNVDLNSKKVNVNFKGDTSVQGADWRVSIVAKTKQGETRYSSMWNSGENSLMLQGDEEKVYLVVCATPDEMKNLEVFDENAVGTKYPYEVQVTTSNETGNEGDNSGNTGDNQGGSTGDNSGSTDDNNGQEAIKGQVKVEMYSNNQSSNSNTIAPMFRLTNTGDTAIMMTDLELRYYYTKDEDVHQNLWCDWSNIGSENIAANFVDMNATASADNYVSLTFKAGEIAPGGVVYINTRIARDNWSNYVQEGDYSFKPGSTSYEEWSKVTLYSNGDLIWGIEP
nr:DUF6055 domain-containing protein [uncultured Cellulosilyticum sp.]